MGRFRKFTHGNKGFSTSPPLEHWYRDNTVYFITARCRDRYPAFANDAAIAVFWDRFAHWTSHYEFVPYVATLMNNHYHFESYLKGGENLGPMMQRIHGSVAKLVNDLLPERRLPFWREAGRRDYFDGCIRDETQCRLAYTYTQMQSVRAGIVRKWRDYPHTRVYLEFEEALQHARERKPYLEDVEYKRYKRINSKDKPTR